MLTDNIIVEQLIVGISNPSILATFSLFSWPLVGQLGVGMSPAEAQQLISAIPFDLATVLRPMMVDAETPTAYLLTAYLIVL